MPELPEMQALAERLDTCFRDATLTRVDPLGFSALETVRPAPDSFVGHAVVHVGRRAKYLIVDYGAAGRILIHLSQSGRLDIEEPPKRTRARGSVVRFVFDDERAWLVREYGSERKARWWVLAPGDDGPLDGLGPEPDSDEFADVIERSSDKRRLHTVLRDQRTVSGVGRGYADDALHRAQVSPFATLTSLDDDVRTRLLESIRAVLGDALDSERGRVGGLSAPKLGDRFAIHRRSGTPCPRCEESLRRVSYDAYEITYCPRCQTGGKVFADRRMSRLVK